MNYDDLIMKQKYGDSLACEFYLDEEIYLREMDRIFSTQWLFVDHASRIPNPGDYLLFEIGRQSIVVIRSKDRRINALSNVCRHRGSRICLEELGNKTRLTCPYHAWSYDLDGRLVAARLMPEDFDKSTNSLLRYEMRELDGLLFINLSSADERPDFEEIADNVRGILSFHRLDRSKAAHRQVYRVRGNWKLVVENYLECYHCIPSHPEYCRAEIKAAKNSDGSERALKKYEATERSWHAVATEYGYPTDGYTYEVPLNDAFRKSQFHAIYRAPLRDGYLTTSDDGKPLAPLMGEFHAYDGGETAMGIGPFFFMVAANDHAVLFRFTPIDPVTTDIVVTWVVEQDAVEGQDYDLHRLMHLWDVTTQQDKQLIENNQLGVESPSYLSGTYSLLETDPRLFVQWYLAMIGPDDYRDRLQRRGDARYVGI